MSEVKEIPTIYHHNTEPCASCIYDTNNGSERGVKFDIFTKKGFEIYDHGCTRMYTNCEPETKAIYYCKRVEHKEKPIKRTNFDRIKAMSIDEMAMWFAELVNGMCGICDADGSYPFENGAGCEIGDGEEVCAGGIKLWLQREAEE